MKKPTRADVRTSQRRLAALVTLFGLMQSASKISRELDELASGIGGSIEDIMDAAGIPFFDVHNAYRDSLDRRKVAKKASKPRKVRKKSPSA